MTTRGSISVMTNAADALRAEEIKRTRSLLGVGWIAGIVVAVAVLIAPGDRRIAHALLALLGIGVLGSLWVYRDLRDATRYRTTTMTLLALVVVSCGVLGILYTGTFSAAPVGLTLCIYIFCRTENLLSAIAIYAIAAIAHFVASMLVIAGVFAEPGFYPVDRHASVQALITGQLILQMAYALCFWLARVTRRATLRSIEHLQRATRLAAQRDVQLAELRSDLDRALKIGGPGRFTGVAAGEWELGNVIGRGAMGEVYEATHAKTGDPAAVKLLRRELLADPRHIERFLREVRVAGAIDSPHVVRVLGASTPTDPMPYLAMEKLSGQTLSKLLRDGRSLADPSIAALVDQIGAVLELARATGIVHRDIKPQNLFLTYDNTWKVLDFGVALLAETSGTLTRGAAIGTPAYMAPEQARGETVDHRADLYAFGAVLYRAITGRAPFAARDTPSLLYAVTHDQPLRPSALAAVSPAVEQFLLLALAKSPEARLQTAAELVAAFQAARTGALPEELARRAAALPPWREQAPPPLGAN
ncbi:MAG TPA: serine/threonine-protein kinase [Kofleriaceae bacterium]|nr:serine/threonine-protein kinase [Kofleriaceae bacterium]